VCVESDNTTTVAYLMRQGGRWDHLSETAEAFLQQCLKRNILLVARHIPGLDNTIADQLSRIRKLDIHDWMLNPQVFQQLCRRWGRPTIDLFSSRHNHLLPRWVSWRPQPGAWATNAFSLNWSSQNLGLAWCNPPFKLLLKVLLKARSEGAHMILVAPLWPSAIWFPLLQQMSRDWVELPSNKNDLFIPGGRPPMHNPAWRVGVFYIW